MIGALKYLVLALEVPLFFATFTHAVTVPALSAAKTAACRFIIAISEVMLGSASLVSIDVRQEL
jgi:hypothetical protein